MQFDRVSFSTATTGTGTITAGAATSGFRTLAGASIPDATTVQYAITDGTAWETGTGVTGGTATTLTRVLSQSSTGALLSLSGSATCFLTPIASQYNALSPAGATTTIQYNNAGALGGMSGTAWDDTNRALTLTGATVTTSQPILNLSQTWNAGGVTFTGYKFNVTDTASAAASLLMDLQLGGVSQFKVDKAGNTVTIGSVKFGSAGPANTITGSTNNFIINVNSYAVVQLNGTGKWGWNGNVFTWVSGEQIGWTSSTTDPTQANDTILRRRAAANVNLGDVDAAAPVAQTLSVQSVVAGTTNTAGTNLTVAGSQGTGTGIGGDILFQVAPAGSTGTAQNALVTGLRISNTQTVTVPGSFSMAGNISAAAWTTAGLRIAQAAATLTDTSSTGTVAAVYANLFGAPTVAASSATTYTNAYGAYFADPVAGTNVTLTNKYSLGVAGTLFSDNTYAQTELAVFQPGSRTNKTFSMYGPTPQLGMSVNTLFGWHPNFASGSQDTILTRKAAANIQHGGFDAAAPVAQTISVQSVVAGTTNTAGSNFTINGSQGTGTGAGGSILFQVAPAGTTGTAQNALTSVMTVRQDKTTVISAAFTVATLPAAGVQGRRAHVTDATTPTFLGTLTGGGAVVTPVYDNGTAWVAG